ncbi:MAG TPA: leucyl aminopeptidase family protein [Solirubrobacteraceae bacterium]|jgi:leucyl aminopeptidase|nr:leucyl aminopeptidase family protein [Solirubrobacteraceae bacterium]
MNVELTGAAPAEVEADTLVLPAGGEHVRKLDPLFDGRLARAAAEADPVSVLPVTRELRARRVVVVALDASHPDGVATAAARAVRAHRGGGTVAWALDEWVPMALERQLRAVVEGAVLGGYDAGRWKSDPPGPRVERFVVCGAAEKELPEAAARTEVVARWTNVARELVDGPPNVITPARLAERAAALPGVRVEVLDPVAAGLPALAAVGGSSAAPPQLVVVRHQPPEAPERPRLALVGKAVTFDAGGYFLKSQSDIVRQKGDMAGGAAVLAALGAIAELELSLGVVGVLAACENMIGPDAVRPSDVILTAAGLTVEVTNPDAEGRLILADALWYARRDGATHVIDLATLTGAMRAGMGDVFAGVFGNDDNWRDAIVDAGTAVGDRAWPWPLHPRYDRLLESKVADLKNTSGRPYGYPITAATFLERFAGGGPWAHVDMLGPALLDDDRGDAVGAGASGYGVRMLVEVASRLAAALARGARPERSLDAFIRQQVDEDD